MQAPAPPPLSTISEPDWMREMGPPTYWRERGGMCVSVRMRVSVRMKDERIRLWAE